jgi:ABC-type branched-subunit amino acid transport system ATPase component
MNVDEAIAYSRRDKDEGFMSHEMYSSMVTLAAEVERLRAMLVNLAIPVEALLLDEGSHKYIAPTVLAEIQAALKETRKQMRGAE